MLPKSDKYNEPRAKTRNCLRIIHYYDHSIQTPFALLFLLQMGKQISNDYSTCTPLPSKSGHNINIIRTLLPLRMGKHI